ncbi:MAG: sigma-70 family RNA polymerase sigma factor [Spirochaetia bacterium]|nr:sigma-70 family RNA polymerase sigma factor [Spirochaetia bacterium]
MINSSDNLKLTEKEEMVKPLLKGVSVANPEYLQKFFDLFSDDIYNFPIRYYNFTEDEAGDFYIYAFEHLKNGKKISSYKYKSKFTTWFFSVLRNLVIDFLRTQKNKIRFTSFYKVDSDGNTVNTLENMADIHSTQDYSLEKEISDKFTLEISSLKIYNRVLFKLAFINYVDLNTEEIDWLCENNHLSQTEIIKKLARIKETGLVRSNKVRQIEDKLTLNFQSITQLENRIHGFFLEHPSIAADPSVWSEDFENSAFPPEINIMITSLVKKRKKHITLIQNQKKSLLTTRIPYKDFAHLLGTTDGVVSVQLLRIIEKLNVGLDIHNK